MLPVLATALLLSAQDKIPGPDAQKKMFEAPRRSSSKQDALVVASAERKTNTVRVSCDKSTRGLYVLVDPKLLDPKKEITVFLGEKELYRGVPEPDLATILVTGARGDPELAYTTRIPLF